MKLLSSDSEDTETLHVDIGTDSVGKRGRSLPPFNDPQGAVIGAWGLSAETEPDHVVGFAWTQASSKSPQASKPRGRFGFARAFKKPTPPEEIAPVLEMNGGAPGVGPRRDPEARLPMPLLEQLLHAHVKDLLKKIEAYSSGGAAPSSFPAAQVEVQKVSSIGGSRDDTALDLLNFNPVEFESEDTVNPEHKAGSLKRLDREMTRASVDGEVADATDDGHRDTILTSDVDRALSSTTSSRGRLKRTSTSNIGNIGGGKRRNVFPDARQMKQVVKDAMGKHPYDVADFYWRTGFCQKIARAHWFDLLTLGVIALNALWISVDLDHNQSAVLIDAEPVFQVAENFFCLYFTVELCIRFMAFQNKRNCIRDGWFCFDTILVTFMVAETWLLSLGFLISGSREAVGDSSMLRLVRLVRLTRMARMIRLLRAFPELLALVKGIGVASRSVFFTAILMLIVTYMFAIVLTQLTAGSEIADRYFDTVPDAMKNMLIYAIFPDLDEMLNSVGLASWLWVFILTFFIFLISLTLLNMLVGVLCEVVGVVSAVEKEELMANYLRDELRTLLEDLADEGEDQDHVTKEDFCDLLLMPGAVRLFNEIGIDVVALANCVDVIFQGGKCYDFGDIVALLLDLRGSNTCTVKDIVDLRKYITQELVLVQCNIAESLRTGGEGLAVAALRDRRPDSRMSR
eukprot:TRINITY_DN41718_c0_g1_i2.p1 TRINITY_DN41718_c0_g1~~TRINITY_DN41718_c0_g1_i2.p1  ORF type:complete len:684 (-),score=171.06 TRINITY_DN41718_c0_g1_i2:130-2181(-)